ncbi:MAG TPA: MBL fold metallo-hydrolase [Anaerolineae bacterium]|nr:MBL fold metallo-hydrolase [Anaerolineae bacterium]HQH39018.1 MBL fold metallo-hydrolase [Anaerolineae bacterium]
MSTHFIHLTSHLWVTQSALFATNSGVFLADDEACLVDPGIAPETSTDIARFVTEQGATPRAIVLTHAHWDHVMGPEHFPGVPVIAHADYRRIRREHGEDLQRQVAAWEAQAHVCRTRPFVLPQPTYAFDTALTLTLGNARLRLVHAPGHAPDQCIAYHVEEALLWAADMLSDVEIPFVHSLTAYEQTLAHLATLDLRVLVPGHGAPTTDADEIRRRLMADRAYLAELRERVAAAVAAGQTLAETVVACAAMPLPRPANDPTPHTWNVESAYAELGGCVEEPVGWEREWSA